MKLLQFKYCILLGALFVASCKKDLEEKFPNPENYSETGNLFPGMWTGMLYSWKLYIQDYGEWYWLLNDGMGVTAYSQIAQRYITPRYGWFSGYNDLTGQFGFGSTNNLWENRLNDYYTRLRSWATIKDKLATISGQQLTDNEIYFSLATLLKDYGALLNVDFYNSIPYSEAFKGSERVFFPKYDDPKEIYTTVLTELKTISEELPALYNQLSEIGRTVFAQQDIAFKGDIQKWVQYINAIRLRYSVRISGVDAAFAKTQIDDVLAKNNLPPDDQTWNLPTAHDPIGGGTWIRGLYENSYAIFMPNIIMRRLNRDLGSYQPGIDDPRLPVLAMPTKHWDTAIMKRQYRGVSYDADSQVPAYTAGDRYYVGANDFVQALRQNGKSAWSHTTFVRNKTFPNYMSSLAETDLLLAEVALKNLTTTAKDAGAYLKDAIVHSTKFWYAINQQSDYGRDSAYLLAPAIPTEDIINTYADSIVNRFNTRATLEDKMEILMQQKYIHLNIMNPYELWAELRRTRHPFLEPFTFNAQVMKPMPERLRYPSTEFTNNTDQYMKVKDQDNFTSPVFWVPTAQRSINPYWNNYDYE